MTKKTPINTRDSTKNKPVGLFKPKLPEKKSDNKKDEATKLDHWRLWK